MRDHFADAQHEAAHVVVGVALGLKLREATINPSKRDRARGLVAYTLFRPTSNHEAYAIMCAAGVAWEARQGFASAVDRRLIREHFPASAVRVFATAAAAILKEREAAHARVTEALLQGSISGADVARIAAGEPPEE